MVAMNKADAQKIAEEYVEGMDLDIVRVDSIERQQCVVSHRNEWVVRFELAQSDDVIWPTYTSTGNH